MLYKLEQLFFYGLLIALPLQLRRVLYYPGWVFNEWKSVSFFATDILVAALLLFWLYDLYKKGKYQLHLKKEEWLLVLFILVSAVSIDNSSLKYLGWYDLAKLIEFIALYFYLVCYARYRFSAFDSVIALLMGGFFQSSVAIAQFVVQKSIGLKYLGESVIGTDIPGVAAFYDFSGRKIIRAYGTTPHSNVLAGFLLLVLLVSYWIWLRHHEYFKTSKAMGLFYAMVGVTTFGFLVTFSRTDWFIWAAACLSLCAYVFFRERTLWPPAKKLIYLNLIVGGVFLMFYWPDALSRLLISKNEEAVQLRVYFAEQSLDTKGPNLFGVGIGNFVPWLMKKNPGNPDWLYQPVHNIYLLAYAETGIIGAGVFVSFIIMTVWRFVKNRKFKDLEYYPLLIAGCFLFIGLFDHYLFTLQQGRFLLWASLALISV